MVVKEGTEEAFSDESHEDIEDVFDGLESQKD